MLTLFTSLVDVFGTDVVDEQRSMVLHYAYAHARSLFTYRKQIGSATLKPPKRCVGDVQRPLLTMVRTVGTPVELERDRKAVRNDSCLTMLWRERGQ